jgi:hypothetical protein
MDDPGLDGVTESVHARDGAGNGWAPPGRPDRRLTPGDRYTIAGVYRRRTWWEWLTRTPRRLQVWVVTRRQP